MRPTTASASTTGKASEQARAAIPSGLNDRSATAVAGYAAP